MNDAYEILSGETKVAVWRDERLTVLNPDLLPLYFQMNQNLKVWLTTRAADNRRPHIRLLKKALRLTEKNRRHRKSRILITHQNKKQAQACFLSE